MKRDKSSPWEFLWYALYAFAGLGLELVLMGGVEPALFGGTPPSRYTAAHTLLHWGMTMACWGLTAALLYRGLGKRSWALPVCGLAAEAIMVAGYWLYDALLASLGGQAFAVSLIGSAAGIPSNLVQAAFGAVVSTLLAMVLRRSGYVRKEFPHL